MERESRNFTVGIYLYSSYLYSKPSLSIADLVASAYVT